MTDEYTQMRIAETRGPTYRFQGKLIGEYSTNPDGIKARWEVVELWETRAGVWLAVSRGCSDMGRERDLVAVGVIEPGPDDLARKLAAMEAWDWTPAARRLAKALGWALVVELE